MKPILFVVLLLTISQSLFALDRVQDLQSQMPDAKPYDILKTVFLESTDSISMAELTAPLQKCVMAYAADVNPGNITKLTLITSSKVLVPAVPAQEAKGPLFPAKAGIAAQTQTHTGVILDAWFVNAAAAYLFSTEANHDRLFDSINTSSSANQISSTLVTTPSFPLLISGATLNIRRNGNILSLQELVKGDRAQNTKDSDGYGYCWVK